MLTISRDKVYDRLDKNIPPSAICESGETVIFETRDCYDDSVTSEERPLGDREDALGNPATGPLYINGADAGDVLKVEILDISLHSRGVMCASFSWGIFAGRLPEAKAVMYEIEGDKIRFDDTLLLDCCPMIGVIGTAPAGEGIATSVPDVHGGNMDCRKSGRERSFICLLRFRERCFPWVISMPRWETERFLAAGWKLRERLP